MIVIQTIFCGALCMTLSTPIKDEAPAQTAARLEEFLHQFVLRVNSDLDRLDDVLAK